LRRRGASKHGSHQELAVTPETHSNVSVQLPGRAELRIDLVDDEALHGWIRRRVLKPRSARGIDNERLLVPQRQQEQTEWRHFARRIHPHFFTCGHGSGDDVIELRGGRERCIEFRPRIDQHG
jgi:hypothetical protein